jgi:hypothetical protein
VWWENKVLVCLSQICCLVTILDLLCFLFDSGYEHAGKFYIWKI